MPAAFKSWAQHRGPELLLAVMTLGVFLGFLGTMDLWGKREQRAAAEAIDTLQNQHWLVAQIQGRPRLEKPPLPRWTIATLMVLTGSQDEWVVRLPGALSAVGLVALTYAFGRRFGGRRLALASCLILISIPFLIIEMRQAGNDGPLAFFTTLALYACWRRLHDTTQTAGQLQPPAASKGSRAWNALASLTLGLGFLTKGPVILVLVALTIIPYLLITRRLWAGLRALADPVGAALFVLVALSWPVPVMLGDPNALRVWLLEMGQKAGSAGIQHHRDHAILATEWFWMAAPWCVLGLIPMVWAPIARRRDLSPGTWFAWCWTALNLIMFCFWTVAKPNYFLPCMPGAALLIAAQWLALTEQARETSRRGVHARRFLAGHWVVLLVAAAIVPVLMARLAPSYLAWSVIVALGFAGGVIGSMWCWKRKQDLAALGFLAAGITTMVLVGYGGVAPGENASRSHRRLAAQLDSVIPAGQHTVMFFHELDEGLWFYLKQHTLKPIPGSNPTYNDGFDMLELYRRDALSLRPSERIKQQRDVLLHWLNQPQHDSPYVLIRADRFDALAPAVASRIKVVLREEQTKRNDLLLFRLNPEAAQAASASPAPALLR